MSLYTKLSKIGQGSFGNVFLCEHNQSCRIYAVKEVKISLLSDNERKQTITEIEILAKCKHINVIKYKEAYIAGECLCLAMEYASRGKVYVLL